MQALAIDGDRSGHRVEPSTLAVGAQQWVEASLLIGILIHEKGILLAGVVFGQSGLKQARAGATGAPAESGVVREEARLGLGQALTAARAGAFGGVEPCSGRHLLKSWGLVERCEHREAALAQREGLVHGLSQGGLGSCIDGEVCHRQFDGVLTVAVEPREAVGGHELTVHSEVGVASGGSPLGQVLVDALALNHQGGEQPNMLARVFFQDARHDDLGRLRRDWNEAARALLLAEFHVEQPKEVVNFGQRAHGALAPAAARALFNGHGGWNAVDGVDLRPRGRLQKLPSVGVERFQVTTLALGKENVEGEGGLSRPRHAGDHRELVAWNGERNVL